MLSDIYQHSRLPAAEVERERGVIREEILMYQDQPAQVAEELLAAAIWPKHPLGRPIAGTLDTIPALRRDELLDFWQNAYHARSTVLAVAGRVTHEEVLARVAPALSEMPTGRVPRFTRWQAPKPAGRILPRAIVDSRDVEQVQLVLGFEAPGRRDPARFALRVLNAVLGEKADSRLFQSLRERRGLCYSVGSEVSVLEETGLLTIAVGLETRNLRAALRLIRQEVDAICARPLSARAVREAKDYLIGQHRLGQESTTNQMMWVGESVLGHGRVVLPSEAEASFAAVTPRRGPVRPRKPACGTVFAPWWRSVR